MTKKKKLIFLSILLALLIGMSVVYVFAWLRPIRDSMVLVAGDIKIEVRQARYAFASDISGQEEIIIDDPVGSPDGFHDLNDRRLNTVPLSSAESYVIYEFVVYNCSETDVSLALRFSGFSDYLVRSVEEYAADGTLSSPFKNYTAKNILQLKYLRYSFNASDEGIDPEDIEWIDYPSEENPIAPGTPRSLWHYSYGNYIFGKNGTFLNHSIILDKTEGLETEPAETELATTAEEDEPTTPEVSKHDHVTIRLAIEDNFNDKDSIDEYYAWLTQNDGYCWNRCRNLLGDSANDTRIAEYLAAIEAQEKEAFDRALRSEPGSGDGFQLIINYFEFVGDNVPYHDNATIDNSSGSS